MDREELPEMVEWSLHLGPSFPEVVDTVWESPDFELKHSFLFRELDDRQFSEQFLSAAGKLLLMVLRKERAKLHATRGKRVSVFPSR